MRDLNFSDRWRARWLVGRSCNVKMGKICKWAMLLLWYFRSSRVTTDAIIITKPDQGAGGGGGGGVPSFQCGVVRNLVMAVLCVDGCDGDADD